MEIDVRVIPEWINMLLTIGAFLVLLYGLRRLLYEPVSKVLNERQDNIQNNIDEGHRIKEEAIQLKSQYEAQIQEAKNESQAIIENGKKRGEEVREDIILEAREEAKNILDKAKREIEVEKEKALMEVQNEAGEMAILIASKIIGENLNLAAQEDLIDKFVDEVGKSKWQN
ncbi:MAG: F0F1 ATP synthase subunit B [Tissierellia bacterium]|nr:F0F1 ATP synthase subunit B [Tissierellia bacterium]